MNPNFKKKFNRFLKWVGALFVSYIIWSLLDSITRSVKVTTSMFKNIPNILWTLDIPDVILSLFITILIITSLFLGRKLRFISLDKIKEIKSKNDFLINVNEDLRKDANEIIRLYDKTESDLKQIEKKTELFLIEKEKLESYLGKDKIISILSYLANDMTGIIELDTLYHNSYRTKFPGKERSDYRAVLVFLKREGLVQYVPNNHKEKCAMITDKGIEYLASLKCEET